MVTAALFPRSSSARTTLCRACLIRSLTAGRHQARSISMKVLEKIRLANDEWMERARRIKDGEQQNTWQFLKERGYVKDIAGSDEQISELMRLKRIGAYVGIDPTGTSLHLGHLLPLMPLFWMYLHGYKAIAVLGGATAKIGDPTDRLQSREPISKADLTMNITKIHYQLKRMWINVDIQAKRYGYKKSWSWSRALLNNSQWYNQTTLVEVVARLFNGMRLGPMLSRDNVKRRLNGGDGMSLAEFIYPLMQAWDWWYLFSGKQDVNMQIGGSDQYGNMVTGIDCIKRLRENERDPQLVMRKSLLSTPVAFTVPLLTDSSGAKFGKSSGNAIWLDPFRTSCYDLYGYLVGRPDDDVERLLKLFTFVPEKDIREVMEKHTKDPSQRHAQHLLAYEVLTLVHGKEEASKAQIQHRTLFSRGPTRLSLPTSYQTETEFYPSAGQPADNSKALSFRTDITLPESLIMGKSIGRILYAAGLASSASDGHRLVASQGAYIGGSPGQPAARNRGISYGELTFTPVKNWFPQDTARFLVEGKLLILRRGKHFIRVVKMVSDKEWEESGRKYPGEPMTGQLRQLRKKLQNADTTGASPETLEEVQRVLDETADSKTTSIDSPGLRFPQRSRAAELLRRAEATKWDRKMDSKAQTWAIDEVLQETKRVLEEKRQEEKGEDYLKEYLEAEDGENEDDLAEEDEDDFVEENEDDYGGHNEELYEEENEDDLVAENEDDLEEKSEDDFLEEDEDDFVEEDEDDYGGHNEELHEDENDWEDDDNPKPKRNDSRRGRR